MTTCTDKDKQNSSTYDIKGKKRFRANMKKNERHRMIMFVYMNAVNYYELQYSNEHA